MHLYNFFFLASLLTLRSPSYKELQKLQVLWQLTEIEKSGVTTIAGWEFEDRQRDTEAELRGMRELCTRQVVRRCLRQRGKFEFKSRKLGLRPWESERCKKYDFLLNGKFIVKIEHISIHEKNKFIYLLESKNLGQLESTIIFYCTLGISFRTRTNYWETGPPNDWWPYVFLSAEIGDYFANLEVTWVQHDECSAVFCFRRSVPKFLTMMSWNMSGIKPTTSQIIVRYAGHFASETVALYK